ncbi:MAG: triose-phosphate isomerase [Deltaproteobacteria bacterium]|nr:triose-phosphate isomerase [Deltaproteobacteria bacterium]
MFPPLIVGNWKMYKTITEGMDFVVRLRARIKETAGRKVVIAPPFTALYAMAGALKETGIGLAAQNVWDREAGAFTGEVSPRMLVDAGCQYVIVGHSERRALFGEGDALINRKLKAVIQSGLQPILCIGETLSEREAGQTFAVVDRQITEGLKDISAADAARVVLAYEPVWAIGTGQTASPEQAAAVHKHIRGVAGGVYGEEFSRQMPVIYGGSVNPANIKALMAQRDINGVLVGGASLDVESFAQIVEF